MATISVISFDVHVRSLFRLKDVNAMVAFGGFDLSSYGDVKAHAEDIYKRLANGTMPCDARWAAENVELFRKWIDGGMNP